MRLYFILGLVFFFVMGCFNGSFAMENNVAIKEVVSGNNKFALEIYKKLLSSKKDENLFLSPYSISSALAMTYAGAKGETEKSMEDVLHFPPSNIETHVGFMELMKSLDTSIYENKPYELFVANRLWGQKGYKFNEEFLKSLEKYYKAGLEILDFKNNTEESRLTINKWVELKTNDKIKNLLQRGTVTSLTRLILTNAIYFKSNWMNEFNKKSTKQEDFYVSSCKTIKVPTMYQKDDFLYYEDKEIQSIQLQYKQGKLSMVIFLPKEIEGLRKMEETLSCGTIEEYLKKSSLQKVRLYLPKFKTVSFFKLKRILSSMGMANPFSHKANFSGIGKEIFISDVIHKAFVDVDEKGTEAAAATAVAMVGTAAPIKPRKVYLFKADHPFMFLIKDNKNGTILFMGRINKP